MRELEGMERNNNVRSNSTEKGNLALGEIFVVTGAHDTGKSSVLQYLKEVFGYQISLEAAGTVLKLLGQRSYHPTDLPFILNNSKDHICPRCKPIEFTKLVLAEQLKIEKACFRGGKIFLDRGYFDCLVYLRWIGIGDFSCLDLNSLAFARYKLVFLLEVMEELQEPKFGKSLRERINEAVQINKLTFQEYASAGYKVIIVPPGTIEQRASIINAVVQDHSAGIEPPHFYIIDSQEQNQELLAIVNDFLKRSGLYSSNLLYRVTGEKHLSKVLMYGTDRAGFTNEMFWKERGYFGPPKAFEDVIYASTEEEITRGLKIEEINTAFKKIPLTIRPYLLVYDKSQFELVHPDHQYAFKNPSQKKKALVAVIKLFN